MLKKSTYKILYSIFLLLIFLSFSFMLLGLNKRDVDNSFDAKKMRDWSEGWTVKVDTSEPMIVDLPVKLGSPRNSVVSITKTLPGSMGVYNCLMIESKRQEIYVYVDNTLRARYTDEGQKIGNSLPSSYLMTPMYNTDAGSIVRIVIISDTYYSGNISNVYLGSEMSLLLMLIKSNILWVALTGVIFIFTIVCITCYIIYKNIFSDSIQFIHLFWFGLFTTIWCFSQIRIRQIFLSDLSIFESIGHCCFMLIPYAVLLVSNYFSDHRHPIYHLFGFTVSLVNFLVQNISHTGFKIDYFQMQNFTQLFLFWIVTTCLAGCVYDSIKGRMVGRNLVTLGFAGLLAGILIEVRLTVLNIQYISHSYYILGSLIFIASFLVNIFYDFRKVDQAKRNAESANKAKSLFLATMSHEIRTPINVVLGMNEMILRESNDNNVINYAQNIEESGKSLLSLVNDILDFSKIESGKMDIVKVDYYIRSLLNDLVMMTKNRIGNKPIKLVLDFDESIPTKYYGDEVRIKQILTNLLTNAVKYTDEGTISFSVKCIEKDNTDIKLEFSVKDTGLGITKENIEKLTSSTFIRFDEQKNRNIEGTGLGIAITRQLLELMDSELQIESSYGSGSNFYFVLNQHIMDFSALGPFEQKVENEKKKQINTFIAPNAKILAVDDTKANLFVIKGLLKPYNMTVDTVLSGIECIDKVKENHYDIVFMDHMMPDMDGIETLHVLRRDNLLTPETKIIALTANAISGAEEMYIGNGFDGYLTKPIDISALDVCIRNNLNLDKIENI